MERGGVSMESWLAGDKLFMTGRGEAAGFKFVTWNRTGNLQSTDAFDALLKTNQAEWIYRHQTPEGYPYPILSYTRTWYVEKHSPRHRNYWAVRLDKRPVDSHTNDHDRKCGQIRLFHRILIGCCVSSHRWMNYLLYEDFLMFGKVLCAIWKLVQD